MSSEDTVEYKVIADVIVSPDPDLVVSLTGDMYIGSIDPNNRVATMTDVNSVSGGGSADIANFEFRDAGGAGVMSAGGNDVTIETNDSKLVVSSSDVEATVYSQISLDPSPYYTASDWESISYTIPFAGTSRISIVGASDTFFNAFSGSDFSVAKLVVVVNDEDEFEVTSRGTSTPTKSITIDFLGEPYETGYPIVELAFNLYEAISYNFTNLGSIELPANGRIINVPNSSGDGNNYSTLELVPDDSRYGSGQYVVIDPTEPDHIHIRAGGAPDNASAVLHFGAELANVQIDDSSHQVRIESYDGILETGNIWTFSGNGDLLGPGDDGNLKIAGIQGGASGSFTTVDGKVVTVTNGIITAIDVV